MTTLAETLSALTPIRADAGQPLHRQVEARVRQLAAAMAGQPGALLPDELTIANRLGVSRGTARAALLRLAQEGVVERKAGVGTRVARPRGESGILAWRSFSREMAAKGIRVENLSLDYASRRATARAAAALEIESGVPVRRLDRLRGWDGQPVLYSSSWFHPRLPLTGSEDFTQPLYDVLESVTGAVADTAQEEFSAIVAGTALAKRLAIRPGSPVLLRRHTVRDTRGRPVEYAEVSYASSRFALSLELKREQP